MKSTDKGIVHTLHAHHGAEVDQIAYTGLLGRDDAGDGDILGQFALRGAVDRRKLSVGQSLDHWVETGHIALGQVFHATHSGLGDEPCCIDSDARHAPQIGLPHPQINLLHGGQLLVDNLAVVFKHLVDQPGAERIAFGGSGAGLEQARHVVDAELTERVADALANALDSNKRTAYGLRLLLDRADNLLGPLSRSYIIGSCSSVGCCCSGSIGLGRRCSVLHS